jgi:hypothetical protein
MERNRVPNQVAIVGIPKVQDLAGRLAGSEVFTKGFESMVQGEGEECWAQGVTLLHART